MKRRLTGVAVVVVTVLVTGAGLAQAFPGPGNRGGADRRPPGAVNRIPRLPDGAHRFMIDDIVYWVHAGIFYMLNGDNYVIVDAPVIHALPPYHRVVVINNKVYYVVNSVYYRPAPGGYVVVEKPAEVVTIQTASAQTTAATTPSKTLKLYVPRLDGSGFKLVLLTRLESGYLGPQGEFYPQMPTISHLSQIYGVDETVQTDDSDSLVIHVPTQAGDGFVAVTLTYHKDGYLGPQGEFYPVMPKVAQLTAMYGGSTNPVEKDGKVTMLVTKKDGSTVKVVLKKHEDGYLGPQGEFYPELPGTDYLTELYGN